jgi:hypothetical protein
MIYSLGLRAEVLGFRVQDLFFRTDLKQCATCAIPASIREGLGKGKGSVGDGLGGGVVREGLGAGLGRAEQC